MFLRATAVAVVLWTPLVATGVAEAPTDAPRAKAGAARSRPARLAPPAPPAPRLLDPGGVAKARRWARRREGAVAFAVKAPGRRIRGRHAGRQFPSASVVKAMLALAVVRNARHRDLTAGERALLTPMIRESDNDAADDVYFGLVGGPGLQRVARAAHMRRFGEVGYWANELITAADQARLFIRIDRLAPRRHRRFLRRLLASIVPWQRWGIAPAAERRGFHVLFKGGWRLGIAHQVALLERDGRRVALAVLTSGTSDPYGRATEAGIARRVLARPYSG